MVSIIRLAYLEDKGEVKAVAGIRISEWLHGGKYVEIDDLVSKSESGSKGYGGKLFDWVVEFAKAESCDHVRASVGLQRSSTSFLSDEENEHRGALFHGEVVILVPTAQALRSGHIGRTTSILDL